MFKLKLSHYTIIILILISITPVLNAQEPYAFNEISFLTDEIGFGARAIGMGGAYLTQAEDYSAVYWNPAALGLIASHELYTCLAHNNRNIETGFLNIRANNDFSATTLNAIGAVYSVEVLQGSLVLAAGYNRIQNYNSLFQYSGFNSGPSYMGTIYDEPYAPNSLNQKEIVDINGNLSQLSASMSMEVAEGVFIGGTASLFNGYNDYNQIFTERDLNNLYTLFPNDFSSYQRDAFVNTEISGFEIGMGLLYRHSDRIRFGATIYSPRFFHLKENWAIREDISFDDNTVVNDFDDYGMIEYRVRTPFHLRAGLSYMFGSGVIAAEVSVTDWSQIRFTDEYPVGDISASMANRNIRETLRPVFNPKFGLEYNIPKTPVKFRTGFGLVMNPVKNTGKDVNQKIFTVGLGIRLSPNISLDIADRRGFWKTENVSELSGVSVNEKHTNHHLFTSLTFSF